MRTSITSSVACKVIFIFPLWDFPSNPSSLELQMLSWHVLKNKVKAEWILRPEKLAWCWFMSPLFTLRFLGPSSTADVSISLSFSVEPSPLSTMVGCKEGVLGGMTRRGSGSPSMGIVGWPTLPPPPSFLCSAFLCSSRALLKDSASLEPRFLALFFGEYFLQHTPGFDYQIKLQ